MESLLLFLGLSLLADPPKTDRRETAPPVFQFIEACDLAQLQRLPQSDVLGARDARGKTALQRSIENGCEGVTSWLLEVGANADDYAPMTPSPLALAAGKNDVPLIRDLLASGAALQREGGQDPLEAACASGAIEALNELLERGASPNHMGVTGQLPLNAAARRNREAVLVRLLAAGADPNAPDRRGLTALHVAADERAAGSIVLLLRHGADPRARDLAGLDSLLHLLKAGNWRDPLPAACALLAAGCPIDTADESNRTCLSLAMREINLPLAKVLLQLGASREPAADGGRWPIEEAFESLRPLRIPNAPARKDLSPAPSDREPAAPVTLPPGTAPWGARKEADVVELVSLSLAADPLLISRPLSGGRTLLHLAATCSQTGELVRWLLLQGSDRSVKDSDGKTPLDLALARTELLDKDVVDALRPAPSSSALGASRPES